MKPLKLIVPILLVLFAMAALAAEIPPAMHQLIDQMHNDAESGKDMPKELPGIAQVSTDEAYKLWKSKGAIFLDNRLKSQFDAERIEGATWFFCDDLLANLAMASKLDASKKYVLYCNGPHCWRSPSVALVLKHLGVANVLWYRDGIPDWKKKGYSTE